MLDFLFQVVQQILLGLLDGEPGNALKRFPLLTPKLLDFLLQSLGLLELAVELLLFLLVVFAFLVKRFLFLLDASFLLADFAAALLELLFGLGTQMNGLLLRLQGCFFFLCLRTFYCLVDNSPGLNFSLADFRLRDFFPI